MSLVRPEMPSRPACLFRQSLVKRSIEDRDLRQAGAKYVARGKNSLDVQGIVQRRQIDALVYAPKHLLIDQHRMSELLAAVDYSMTDGVNIGNTSHFIDAGRFGANPVYDHVNGRAGDAQRRSRAFGLAACVMQA